ncbi:hypothetical protein [Actinoplanes sp. N902-109]|uniref:hypothetical protein n=1 Tax=Actinoplanes sp. (strain N902-109) TaxID=649831 RepID=UPI0003A66B09|nr:hypothetical protein [Actinoplanes sp. N902-109]
MPGPAPGEAQGAAVRVDGRGWLHPTDTGVGHAAAAYDQAARRLVVNTGAAQTLTFGLSRFAQVAGGVTSRPTVPAAADRYTVRTDARLSGKSVQVPVAAAAVRTVQIGGVVA